MCSVYMMISFPHNLLENQSISSNCTYTVPGSIQVMLKIVDVQSVNVKQEAHGPHLSPEKPVQINKHI